MIKEHDNDFESTREPKHIFMVSYFKFFDDYAPVVKENSFSFRILPG